jgi:RNA 3'-terminal phosphate cyclase
VEERGKPQTIEGVCFSRNLPPHVCQLIGDAVRKRFLDANPRIDLDRGQGPSTGAGIQLWAGYENTILGGDSLGERGLPADKVGDAAASSLRQEMDSQATLDVHAADQILPYLALSKEPSRFLVREVSGHLSTQAELVHRFLGAEVTMKPMAGGSLVTLVPRCT